MSIEIHDKSQSLCNGIEETCCGISHLNYPALTEDDLEYLKGAATDILGLLKGYKPKNDDDE